MPIPIEYKIFEMYTKIQNRFMTVNEEQIEEERKEKRRFWVYHGCELAETNGNRFSSAFGQEDEKNSETLIFFRLFYIGDEKLGF